MLYEVITITMPAHVAPTHTTTLTATLVKALVSAPSCIRLSVSMEKVEKVVNAPSIPTIRAKVMQSTSSMERVWNACVYSRRNNFV